MKQIMSKKWIAYVKAHIEGDDYYFSFPFSIPEGLYNGIIEFLDKDQLLTSFEKYEELLSYA